jgi:hypothetical protein
MEQRLFLPGTFNFFSRSLQRVGNACKNEAGQEYIRGLEKPLADLLQILHHDILKNLPECSLQVSDINYLAEAGLAAFHSTFDSISKNRFQASKIFMVMRDCFVLFQAYKKYWWSPLSFIKL